MSRLPKAYRAVIQGAVLLVSAVPGLAQTPPVGVDPRAELMGIIFRLAGNPEYNQCRIPRYERAIDNHFLPVRDHEAIRLARRLNQSEGIGYDAVMSLAINVRDAYTLNERVPFDGPDISLDKRWRGPRAREFLEAARRFVAESHFREFVQSQGDLYELAGRRLRAIVDSHIDFKWFENFFGPSPEDRYVLVPLLVTGMGSFGPQFRARDGGETIYAILGSATVDQSGAPIYGEQIVPSIIHEFAHTYVKRPIREVSSRFESSATRIYSAVQGAMEQQAYGKWITMVEESLVRASVARYIHAHHGSDAAADEVRKQRNLWFFWTPELFDLLGQYEDKREQYQDLASFMPRVIGYFDGLAPRIEQMIQRYDEERPKIVAMNPANEAQEVDPNLTELTFRFDRPMRASHNVRLGPKGKDARPEILGLDWDASRTLFTMRVRLKANHSYEFPFNWEYGGTFQSREGIPLKFYWIRFRTGAPRP